MFQSTEQAIGTVTVLAVMLLISFPIHEFSHALAAYRLGDGTAKLMGRLTLNPLAHFDPAGGTLLAITMLLGNGFAFGWAKPTPVNTFNLRGGRHSDAIVALAGPLSNLALAAVAAIPFRVLFATGVDAPLVLYILYLFVQINVALAVFNLIPLPPLDGSHVLLALVDPQTSWRLKSVLERYGSLILLVLIFLPSITGGPSPLSIIFEVIARPITLFLLGQ